MSSQDGLAVFSHHFESVQPEYVTRAPGRVNLIGEHTDYNGLPVFPMAIQRTVSLHVAPGRDEVVRVANADPRFPPDTFRISGDIPSAAPGAWGNYVRAAAQALSRRLGALRGIDAVVASDLPVAAGLSSSSALTVATAVSLLHANDAEIEPLELMELIAQGERYVGTEGGGMDQAICLAGRRGTALKIDFDPLRLTPTPVPSDWKFVIAHTLTQAEKSGAARDTYNRRGRECGEAIAALIEALPEARGVTRYPDLIELVGVEALVAAADRVLDDPLRRRFRHVVTEAGRVEGARIAMVRGDHEAFGGLMSASHASLRDDYEVSCGALDELVDLAMGSGAVGARLTGAGLGGCIVALCPEARVPGVVETLTREFYGPRGVTAPAGRHVIVARPSDGASVTPL